MIITKLQVAPVELVVSSESSCAVRLARYSQNAWARHVERVESCRVESRQAKWNFGFITDRPSYMIIDCRRPSFSGRRCLCLERTTTSCHVCIFEPFLFQLSVAPATWLVSLSGTFTVFGTYLLTYLLTSYIYLRSIISNDRNCDEDLSCRPATSNSTAQCWHYGNRAKSHCQPQRDFLLFLYCYIYLWIWKLNCQIQHIQIRIQAHKIIGYRKFRFKRYETGIRMTREQETNANGGTSFRRLLSPVWHMTWHDMTRQNKSWQKIRLICVHKNIDRQLMLTHKFFT